MRLIFLLVFCCLISLFAKAQNISALPLVEFATNAKDTSKPMVIYLCGDGGVNNFSKSFCKELSDKGYPTVLFNSLKYFWAKKTPPQAAADVDKVIRSYKATWKRNRVILVGYSFGADVAPFIFTRLSGATQIAIKNIVLLSPSPKTDFEIHVNQMFGRKQTDGVSVIDEINRITSRPVLLMQGEKEDDKIEPGSLRIKNYRIVLMKGGHRYDKDAGEITNSLLQNLR